MFLKQNYKIYQQILNLILSKLLLEDVLKNILDGTMGFDALVSKKGAEITAEVNLAIQKTSNLTGC